MILIERRRHFDGRGVPFPFYDIFTVTLPGQKPISGRGLAWANWFAKKHRKPGQKIVKTWKGGDHHLPLPLSAAPGEWGGRNG